MFKYRKTQVSADQIHNLLTFPDDITTFTWTGQQILDNLEFIAAHSSDVNRRLIFESGVRFTYQSSLPAAPRVSNVSVNGKPLVLTQQYKIVTIQYAIDHGPDKGYLTGDVSVNNVQTSTAIADAVISCLGKLQSITPVVDGRQNAI
ncbi:hypothetical protein HDV06_001956 [Boothiomyces sp. JEL0866]|nr:hypothetical protein HDV06_001956 [Boothiomyces sp. JEL0866]